MLSGIIKDRAWEEYRRKKYPVYIQRVVRGRFYNVSGMPDMVYNFLEDSYESTVDADFVITGLLGEMWPVKRESLKGYDVENEECISCTPALFYSKNNGIIYYVVQTDVAEEFELTLENGTVLKGNRKGIEHGSGDYIICTSFEKGDYRIVNGQIFNRMYERMQEDDGR